MSYWKTPTDKQIEAALQRMRSPDFEAYFFARLENPNWIAPLRERGVFKAPPAPVATDDGGVSYSVWQASKYLARMAAHCPQEVAEVLAELETDNPFVIADIVEAAQDMPVEIAKVIVPVVAEAIQSPALRFELLNVAAFCARLAEGGEADSALALAESMFEPVVESGPSGGRRTDDHWYFEALDQVLPVLVRTSPQGFLSRLFRWLEVAIQRRKHVDWETGEDLSFMWRQAIEEHAQNSEFDFASNLVSRVREAVEIAVAEDLLALRDVLAQLESATLVIFRRFRVHLVTTFAERDVALARDLMLDRSLFDDHRFKHEYAMLLGQRFDMLSMDEKDTWLAWVDGGPDPAELDGAEGPARAQQLEYWQFSRLHWIRSHLEGDRRRFYDRMLEEHGQPTLADLHMYSTGGSWGSISPLTVDELAARSFAEAVELVSVWRPEADTWLGPDIEGLSQTFREYVGSSAGEFSQQAAELIGRPAIYIRGFLSKMVEAVERGDEIDLGSVIGLCSWVLTRPLEERTSPPGARDVLVDKDWQWTRDEISRFVEQVCKARTDNRPTHSPEHFRKPLWSLVEALYSDPSASYVLAGDESEDPRTTDYLTRGINSSRGKAVEAGLEYARWVAKHTEVSEDGQELVPGGFDSMPEVRTMLDWQLEEENRSAEALAIIGLHLGLVFWIDSDWLATNAHRLFDLGEGTESQPHPEGWAAWNAFLVWVRPHVEYYKMFRQQFTYALEQASAVTIETTGREDPLASLSRHIMTLYGRGDIPLDEEGSLVRLLLTEAPPELRRQAIGFVGRVLWREEGLPPEMIDRFMAAWEMYWNGPGPLDAAAEPEAWLFGVWFASEQLPEVWALENLASFVQVVPVPEPDHAVVERLAAVSSVDVTTAVGVLDAMVRGDRQGWHIHIWRSSARSLLASALEEGGDARARAKRTLDYLARRGYPNFLDASLD